VRVRGRLIFPFVAEFYQLDTAATAASPTGTSLVSGFDPDFRTPLKVVQSSTDQIGITTRVESGPVLIPVQIEPAMLDKLQMMTSGESPESRVSMIAHYRDLESLGLVDSDGRPTIRKRDRLARILTVRNELVEVLNPALYVVECQNRGYGFGESRNLLMIMLEQRDRSAITQ
jgi:hypothetical protein